jgi:hypothetical protein
VRCGPQCLQPGSGGIRACQTGDRVAGRDELSDDCRTGLAGTAGNEDMHDTLPFYASDWHYLTPDSR